MCNVEQLAAKRMESGGGGVLRVLRWAAWAVVTVAAAAAAATCADDPQQFMGVSFAALHTLVGGNGGADASALRLVENQLRELDLHHTRNVGEVLTKVIEFYRRDSEKMKEEFRRMNENVAGSLFNVKVDAVTLQKRLSDLFSETAHCEDIQSVLSIRNIVAIIQAASAAMRANPVETTAHILKLQRALPAVLRIKQALLNDPEIREIGDQVQKKVQRKFRNVGEFKLDL